MARTNRIRSKCSIPDCSNLNSANNLCQKHNRRLQRHGDPLFINPKCNRDGKYKLRHKEYVKKWKKDNRVSYNAYLASRKKRVRLATPKWANLNIIRKFYLECPKGFHVDHIIPLNGKEVSGLHVISNLQYLPAIENLRKSNKAA